MVERRASAWSDPRTWVSIVAVLLTLTIAVGGFVVRELSEISGKMENLLVVTTRQSSDSEALKDKVRVLAEDLKLLQAHVAEHDRALAEIHGAEGAGSATAKGPQH